MTPFGFIYLFFHLYNLGLDLGIYLDLILILMLIFQLEEIAQCKLEILRPKCVDTRYEDHHFTFIVRKNLQVHLLWNYIKYAMFDFRFDLFDVSYG